MGKGHMNCCVMVAAAGAGASLLTAYALKHLAKWAKRPKKAKVTYFDIKARAEPVRICVHAAGIPLEDERVGYKEWLKMKAENPPGFGQLPVVEVNNCVVPESGAQMRYFAKLANLYPKDPFDALFCDVAIELVEDLYNVISPSMHETDEKKKIQMREEISKTSLPCWLKNAENFLQEQGGKWVTGKNMTVGDICIALRIEFMGKGVMDGISPDLIDGYPMLKDHMTRVLSSPVVTRYHNSQE
eukprot:52483_1